MPDTTKNIVATNSNGDALISRGDLPSHFLRVDSTQHIVRDRVAIALIAMLLHSHADFLEISGPPGTFVLRFYLPKLDLRIAIIEGSLPPTDWLKTNYDLYVHENRVRLLSRTTGAFVLAGAFSASYRP